VNAGSLVQIRRSKAVVSCSLSRLVRQVRLVFAEPCTLHCNSIVVPVQFVSLQRTEAGAVTPTKRPAVKPLLTPEARRVFAKIVDLALKELARRAQKSPSPRGRA